MTPSNDASWTRRRVESGGARRGRHPRQLAIPSVVPDRGLQGPRRGAAARRAVPRPRPNRSWSATPSSTSATRRTHPVWRSPSPSGRSPTTARSTPSAVTGSRSGGAPGTAAGGAIAAELIDAGPLLSPDGFRFAVARRGLELLTTPAGTSRRRSARSPKRSPCAARRTPTWRRSAAGPRGSWRRGTGPRRCVRRTADESARWSTGTACARPPSR